MEPRSLGCASIQIGVHSGRFHASKNARGGCDMNPDGIAQVRADRFAGVLQVPRLTVQTLPDDGAYPNNDLRTGDTYLAVEMEKDGQWQRVYSDNDFCTTFKWKKEKLLTDEITEIEARLERDTTVLQDLGMELDETVKHLEVLKNHPEVGILFTDSYEVYKELLDILQSRDLKALVLKLFFHSLIEISWVIPDDQAEGVYRLVYYGDKKELFEKTEPFSGVSRTFRVKRKKK